MTKSEFGIYFRTPENSHEDFIFVIGEIHYRVSLLLRKGWSNYLQGHGTETEWEGPPHAGYAGALAEQRFIYDHLEEWEPYRRAESEHMEDLL